MNEFREKLLGGKSAPAPLLRAKTPRAAPAAATEEESFTDLTIPRETGRLANHRDGDRHRLDRESAEIVHDGRRQSVTLINLSGGGAMIEGADALRLWDRVELRLGEWSHVEAAVRWIKGERIGLEFAHETRIETGKEELAEMLSAVLQRSFPDVALAEAEETAPTAVEDVVTDEPAPYDPTAHENRELRHPLIWTGIVHFNHDSTSVRLRNISSGGALIEGSASFPVGSELLLDLGEGGTIFATVHWSRGDAAGLKFHAPFELRRLAEARPEIAGARWVAPDYLRDDRSANSPWASQWGRSDLSGLYRSLGRKSR